MKKIENTNYLTDQLITYIGNKRSLLSHIYKAIIQVKKRTGKSQLRVFDAFSGSSVVSRFMKAHASYIASNDFEDYAQQLHDVIFKTAVLLIYARFQRLLRK